MYNEYMLIKMKKNKFRDKEKSSILTNKSKTKNKKCNTI
jgi:hypothetical protein